MNNRKQVFYKSLLALLLLASTFCIYVPHIIYFSNLAEFADPFLQLIYLPTVIALLFALGSAAMCAVLPERLASVVSACLISLSLIAWVQGDFIGIDVGLIDGSQLELSTHYFETIVYGLILASAILMHKHINKHLPIVVMLVLLAQLSITFFHVLFHQKPTEHAPKDDNEFELYSKQKNVILIVLDTFGSQVFQQIIDQDPSLTDPLKGFVSYPDTISNYPATKGSMPSMLTGSMLPEDKTYQQYIQHDAASFGLPKRMENNGYLSSFISMLPTFIDIYPQRYRSEPQLNPKDIQKANSAKLLDYATLRVLPAFLKHSFYDRGQWFFSKQVSARLKVPTTLPEKAFMMLENHINNSRVNGTQHRFKLLHFGLPHPEFIYDENCEKNSLKSNESEQYYMYQQSACTLKKLNQLLNQYKTLGIYDKSMIVVTSDHGARLLKNMTFTGFPSFFELNASGVLFMIKGINQKQPFRTVNSPLSLLELYEIITNELKHDSAYDNLVSQKRPFYSYRNPHKSAKGYLPDAPLYEVKKDYSKPESWVLEKFININCEKEPLPLEMTFTTQKRSGYCSKHGFTRPDRKNNGTWTRSIDSRILFNLSDNFITTENYLMRLTFGANINHKQKQIDLAVVLNDETLATTIIDNPDLQTWDIAVEKPEILLDHINQIQLLMPNIKTEQELRLGDNTRKLGIFLKSIEIIATD